MNTGEQIVVDYLTYIKQCKFTDCNIQTTDEQGEIDVIGIGEDNDNNKIVYFCEVAVHIQGLSYVYQGKTDNKNKIADKFRRAKIYADKYFSTPTYKHVFMFWSPIVVVPIKENAWNPKDELDEIVSILKVNHDITLELYINESFNAALSALKNYASKQSKEMKSPVMRLFQIESFLNKHVKKLEKRGLVNGEK